MQLDPGLICYKHCVNGVLVATSLPALCPHCQQPLNADRTFLDTPYRVPYPFHRATQSSCAIVIRPTRGDFLHDYKSGDNLHVGITDSECRVFEFGADGLCSDSGQSFDQSLVVRVLEDAEDPVWKEYWNTALYTIAGSPAWTKERYNEDYFNCYSFVIEFLKFLKPPSVPKDKLNKISFCSAYVVPIAVTAARYIGIYREVTEKGFVKMGSLENKKKLKLSSINEDDEEEDSKMELVKKLDELILSSSGQFVEETQPIQSKKLPKQFVQRKIHNEDIKITEKVTSVINDLLKQRLKEKSEKCLSPYAIDIREDLRSFVPNENNPMPPTPSKINNTIPHGPVLKLKREPTNFRISIPVSVKSDNVYNLKKNSPYKIKIDVRSTNESTFKTDIDVDKTRKEMNISSLPNKITSKQNQLQGMFPNSTLDREHINSTLNREQINSTLDREHINSTLDREHINSTLDREHINSTLDREHINSTLDREHINSTLDREHINSTLNREHINSTLNREHINSTLNREHINSTLNREHINSTLNREHINSTLNREHINSTLNREHINSTLNREHINSTLNREHINSTLNREHINSTLNREHINSTLNREHINSTFKQIMQLGNRTPSTASHYRSGRTENYCPEYDWFGGNTLRKKKKKSSPSIWVKDLPKNGPDDCASGMTYAQWLNREQKSSDSEEGSSGSYQDIISLNSANEINSLEDEFKDSMSLNEGPDMVTVKQYFANQPLPSGIGNGFLVPQNYQTQQSNEVGSEDDSVFLKSHIESENHFRKFKPNSTSSKSMSSNVKIRRMPTWRYGQEPCPKNYESKLMGKIDLTKKYDWDSKGMPSTLAIPGYIYDDGVLTETRC